MLSRSFCIIAILGISALFLLLNGTDTKLNTTENVKSI